MFILENDGEVQKFLFNFIIAGATSSVAKSISAPFDRIKLILQNQNSALHILTGERKMYKGLVDCWIRLPKEQGFSSLWRGNGTNLLRYIPQQALNFSFNDFFKHNIQKTIGDVASGTFINYLAGGCAGACATFILYPLKFCQTRLAVDMGSGKPISTTTGKLQSGVEREFNGLADCLKKIVKVESISGLYKAFTIALLGSTIYRAIYFGMFANLKKIYFNKVSHEYQPSKPPIIIEFLLAQSVTITAGLLTYPFDTVGRRVMLEAGREKRLKSYKRSWSAFRIIYAKEGFLAFYRGALTNCVRSVCGALVLVFYDEFLHYTKWKDKIAHSNR